MCFRPNLAEYNYMHILSYFNGVVNSDDTILGHIMATRLQTRPTVYVTAGPKVFTPRLVPTGLEDNMKAELGNMEINDVLEEIKELTI